MDHKSLADLIIDPDLADLISYLGWEALIHGWVGGVIILLSFFIARTFINKEGVISKLFGIIIFLGGGLFGLAVGLNAILAGATAEVKVKVQETFKLAETKGWLDEFTYEVDFDTLYKKNPKTEHINQYGQTDYLVTPYLDITSATVDFKLPREFVEKLELIRKTLGITRIHNLAGFRGKYAIPLDIAYIDGIWTIAPYAAYEKAVERGEAPEDFVEDWLKPQLIHTAYQHLQAVLLYDCCAHPDAEPIVFDHQIWNIDSWAPAESPFGDQDEEARLRDGPFDPKVERHLYTPDGKLITPRVLSLEKKEPVFLD